MDKGFLLSVGLFTKHFFQDHETNNELFICSLHFSFISLNDNIVQQNLFRKKALLANRIEDRYIGYDDGRWRSSFVSAPVCRKQVPGFEYG